MVLLSFRAAVREGHCPLSSPWQQPSIFVLVILLATCHFLPFCRQEKSPASTREELVALRPAGRMGGGWWLIPEGSLSAV